MSTVFVDTSGFFALYARNQSLPSAIKIIHSCQSERASGRTARYK